MSHNPPNPHLVGELGGLVPGTALDAGCGAGAEAVWLAAHGWRVTGVDISATALAHATDRAATSGVAEQVRWVEADLVVWDPGTRFDLVVSSYAHAAVPQLELYDRLASWVAPSGTLLIVGHRHSHSDHPDGEGSGHGHAHSHGQDSGQGDGPPAEATVTAAAVAARLDGAMWEVVTTEERHRTLRGPGGREVTLDDVVVRATRRP